MLHICNAAFRQYCTAPSVLPIGAQDLFCANRWVRDLMGFSETAIAIL